MKKGLMSIFVVAFVILMAMPVFAITSPVITEGQGVVYGMFYNSSIMLGGEYGFTSNIAGLAKMNFSSTQICIGGKYKYKPNMAIVAGIYGSGYFAGLNGSRVITEQILGLYEADLVFVASNLQLDYEVGAMYQLNSQIDIRAGIAGALGNGSKITDISIGLGAGYRF